MKNFTQYAEDSSRLPEGFRRVGYDADSKRYSFKDRDGKLYYGEPNQEYGTLHPMQSTTTLVEVARPSAFSSAPSNPTLTHSESRTSTHETDSPRADAPKTFQDFLPPELITTSSITEKDYRGYKKRSFSLSSPATSSLPNPKAPRDQFVSAVRRSALPRMQGVVHSLQRSITSKKKERLPIPSASPSSGGGLGRSERDRGYNQLLDDD